MLVVASWWMFGLKPARWHNWNAWSRNRLQPLGAPKMKRSSRNCSMRKVACPASGCRDGRIATMRSWFTGNEAMSGSVIGPSRNPTSIRQSRIALYCSWEGMYNNSTVTSGCRSLKRSRMPGSAPLMAKSL